MNRVGTAIVVMILASVFLARAEESDILIAGFDGEDYGQWTTTGDAFGTGPVKGKLPKQQKVSGYQGRALVNSFLHGDKSTGVLTSEPFTISRRYINLLVGGGRHPGKTCVELVLENGECVYSTTGTDKERLFPVSWDVSGLLGKVAQIRIVDQEQGRLGHINVDHIVQSNEQLASKVQEEKSGEPMMFTIKKTIEVKGKYLLLPVDDAQSEKILRITDPSGKFISKFNIRLTDKEPAFWASFDVSRYSGANLELSLLEVSAKNDEIDLGIIRQSDVMPDLDTVYQQPYRPQFHYSPRVGWVNDPNGLVYYDGTYHLFYQHNAYSTRWGNMRWGWATSRDLVHWEEHGVAFEMPEDVVAYSGGGVVDWKNTTGLQKGEHPPILLYVTGPGTPGGTAQYLVFSDDGGKSWKHYSDQPVTRILNRDPKVFWYEPGKHWVMVIYSGTISTFNFSKSKDGIHWEPHTAQEFAGHKECPDLFEMTVEGSQEKKWVFVSGTGRFGIGDCGTYLVGSFDGSTFIPEQDSILMDSGRDNYSTQLFSDLPEGRKVLMSWITRGFNTVGLPGMTANAQFRAPWELTLYRDATGTCRLRRYPVKELDVLRGKEHSVRDLVLEPGKPFQLKPAQMELDIEIEVVPDEEGAFSFEVSGTPITYDCAAGELKAFERSAKLQPVDGLLKFRILVDRTVVEVFANDGTMVMSAFAQADFDKDAFKLGAESGKHRIKQIQAYEMRSIWK